MKKIFIFNFAFVVFCTTQSLAQSSQNKEEGSLDEQKTKPIVSTEKTKQNETLKNSLSSSQEEGEKKETASNGRLNIVRASLVLKVINPDKERKLFEQRVKEEGGYITFATRNRLVFKLPPQKLQPIMDEFSSKKIVGNKKINRQDMTLLVAQLKGRLKSQIEIQDKLQTFFENSDLYSTLEIEQSMMRLVLEIENLKGQLRKILSQTTWSELEISFDFQAQDNVIYVQSPFEWLNHANLESFLESF